MPIYGYRCRECGEERESTRRDDSQPCRCGGVSRRQFSVNVAGMSFQPHFNHSVGAFVNSSRHFDDVLKRRSEENSLRTGVDHNYTRIDGDEAKSMKAVGATDEGLEHTKKVRRDTGLDAPSTTKIVV